MSREREEQRGTISRMAHRVAVDPWLALNVLDDVVGPSNAKLLTPLVAYSAGRAKRGEQLSTLTSGLAGLATLPTMANAGVGLAKFLIPGLFPTGPVGWVAAVAAGALLSMEPNEWLRDSIFRPMRYMTEYDRRVRRLEMGGGYHDTDTAAALRQASVRQMSGTAQAARTWLGQEAAFLHR